MSSRVRILGIAGSLRRGSYNRAALRAAKLLVPENSPEALRALSMYHVTGTAKMGQDADSAVDSKLRFYGVKKLLIADGSIMPTVITGNTQAPCVTIGERMAELLAA